VIVLDASAAVDLALDAPPHSTMIAGHLVDHVDDIHAPHLLDAEVGQALRRLVLSGWLRSAQVDEAISFVQDLDIVRYGHLGLLGRALEILRNFTVYDALYVSLAESIDAPLLTRDSRLARSARRFVHVILVA
jgi:predicted nucleic acid-binding protein